MHIMFPMNSLEEPLLPLSTRNYQQQEGELNLSENENSHTDENDDTNTIDGDSHNRYTTMKIAHSIHRFIKSIKSKKIIAASLLIFASVFEVGEEVIPHLIPVPSTDTSPHNNNNNHNHPTKSRSELITSCATRLTNKFAIDSTNTNTDPFSQTDSPQIKAIQWLITGPGRFIPIPQLITQQEQDSFCSSNTFITPYSLITLAYSLHIDVPSWLGTVQISSISDICTHFHCLTCDDHKTKVTRLHLSNTIHGVSGTIPYEIAALDTLEQIELYDNPKLVGTIPSSIGMYNTMSQLQVLKLHHTNLSGTIPISFSHLTCLKELQIEDTNVSGSVPNEICNLRHRSNHDNQGGGGGQLEFFGADCAMTQDDEKKYDNEPFLKCAWPSCCTNCYHHHQH